MSSTVVSSFSHTDQVCTINSKLMKSSCLRLVSLVHNKCAFCSFVHLYLSLSLSSQSELFLSHPHFKHTKELALQTQNSLLATHFSAPIRLQLKNNCFFVFLFLHSTIGVFLIKKIVAEHSQEECFARSGGVACVDSITSYDIQPDKVELLTNEWFKLFSIIFFTMRLLQVQVLLLFVLQRGLHSLFGLHLF